MPADIVRAQYEELEAIAKRFQQQSEVQTQLRTRVERGVRALQQGGWQGEGAGAFFAEMSERVTPALIRLIDALEKAHSTTLEVKQLLQQAEQEAAQPFQGHGEGQPTFNAANSIDATTQTGLFAPFGGYASVAGPAKGFNFSPFSPWATAPFVAGAVTLGSGPVPILGRWGQVPAGYSNAGKRLWLYFGGQGTDTIFSINPHAGWGRAPYDLAKPNLRLDYGYINVKSGQAFLPNGNAIPVPRDTNFFHWNQEGSMGLKGKTPLWQSFGESITHDHQLLTNNPLPRGNIIGEISGASLVRGASHGLLIVGAGLDIYSVATADNKVEEGIKRASGWGGAWAGAEGGATVGATIGTAIAPGIGTAIGGFVGGLGGGIGGYMAGTNVGETVYHWGQSLF